MNSFVKYIIQMYCVGYHFSSPCHSNSFGYKFSIDLVDFTLLRYPLSVIRPTRGAFATYHMKCNFGFLQAVVAHYFHFHVLVFLRHWRLSYLLVKMLLEEGWVTDRLTTDWACYRVVLFKVVVDALRVKGVSTLQAGDTHGRCLHILEADGAVLLQLTSHTFVIFLV